MRGLMSAICGIALVTTAVIGIAPAAQASVSATVTPESSTYDKPTDVLTSGPCPGSYTHVQLFLNGSGIASNYPVMGITETSTVGFESGYKLPMSDTFKQFAAEQTPPATLSGKYDISVKCSDWTGATSTTLTTVSVWFTDATHYQSDDPNKGVETSVAVEVSPSSALAGAQITMTATMTPSSATGSVTFFAKTGTDDPINLGSRTIVSGTATLKTSSLAGGTPPVVAKNYKIYAEFTPSGEAFMESASDPDDASVTVTTPLSPTKLSNPTLPAAVRVGTEVSCSIGTWQYAQQYEVTIKVGGSTKASRAKGVSIAALKYTPVAADAGKSLTCEVKAYNIVFATSASASVSRTVTASSLTATKSPVISGDIKVGKTVSVTDGTWSPAASSVTYVWGIVKNGTLTPIAGLTTKSIKIPASASGKVLGVTVTAKSGSLTGRATVTAGIVK